MKKAIKVFTVSAAILGLLFAAVLGTADYFTPNSYTITEGGSLNWFSGAFTVVKDNSAEVSVSAGSGYPKSYSAKLMLYHAIPLKNVNVNVVDNSCVVICGTPFGIKMFTNGVVVVGLADIKTNTGTVNPASEAGLKVGDIITTVNGKNVNTNTDVESAVEGCSGRQMKMTVRRDQQKMSVSVQPVRSDTDGLYKVGLWVRDSTAGIGTLTFYDPSQKCFAGLGHGICDSDTGQLMPLLSGDIVPVTISGITRGLKGTPGELRGYFSDDKAIGSLSANVQSGVYGTLNTPAQGTAMQVAMKQDVKTGPAKVYTTIDGSTPKYYDIEIERIDYRDNVQSKNLVLHITDQRLLTQTGGIVQGMSGSPIVQNGKLVGAVTHVFVNDPTRGYGIFSENMLTQEKTVGLQESKLAS